METKSYNPLVDVSEMPRRVQSLPINDAGFPVPWFVQWIDGKPDFRIMDAAKLTIAVREKVCWICGEELHAYKAFVIGPMCAVNLVSAEPPSHTDCATFAAKSCPFLVNPKQKRRESGKPDDAVKPAGHMIERNPGVALVWVTKSYTTFKAPGGFLIRLGPAEEVLWFSKGREATRDEVLASMESGLPALMDAAKLDGDEAVAELQKAYIVAKELVPAL